jgi:hypothetical protein
MTGSQTALDLPLEAASEAGAASLRPAKLPRNFSAGGATDADRVADALTWLRLMVIQRDADLVDHQAQNIAYVDWLLDYPADQVVRVIRGWPRRSRFWPTWLELEEAIERERESADRPAGSGADKPALKIVRDGQVCEFAERATNAYIGDLGRDVTQHEERALFGQALAVGIGHATSMGLEGEDQWNLKDLPKRVPRFDGFVMNLIRDAG